MLIDPLPIKLEQELKDKLTMTIETNGAVGPEDALAYAALVSAAANGRLPRDICQRANVGYARKCGVLRREV